MKEQTPLGMNRTGVHMSPLDTNEMQSIPPSMIPATAGDESALAELRASYIEHADPVGSVPVPGTIKGAITTGASMLTGNQPQMLIDKLGERLAFERTGTRLYDALIAKLETLQEGPASMTLADLQKIRQDEARHFGMLAGAIESIGADPTAQTPCADLAGVESMGLMQVVTDPRTTIAQCLHAILVAEMADEAGWETLIALAEDHGQGAMVSDFTVALNDELAHLQQVRNWFEEATLGRALSNSAIVDDISDANPSQHLH